MTEQVAKWLADWDGSVAVRVEGLEVKPGEMAVYRQGVAAKQEYPDGSAEETHRFALEICLPAHTAAMRAANAGKLWELEEWIVRQDVACSFPVFADRICWRAELISGFALKSSDAAASVYRAQMDLYCMVTEGGEA